ncbi:NHL repeat protein [Stieleria magnilauensis]|uniref:NHL repeat protein n=1 Tax=Stieleria magnilauensis TaxID=2527963 RepID=A0ABX5XXI2_9BACT|nr:NHL repeat protein [Planctomycetes bacterium TBK1r]
MTGADIAASVDDTGSGSLGGDWELEFATGRIESDPILSESYDATWSGLLATPEIATTGERLVNSPATGNQSILNPHQSVAVDGLGNSIVTWIDYSADLSGSAVMAQRFDASGAKLGGQFQVNVTTAGDQTLPVVTADASGRFAIAYVSGDADGTGIYVRRYDASGAAIDAADVLVNAGSESGNQTNVSIASNSVNQIVLSWESSGATEGIYARNFDYTSTPVGNALSTTLLTVDTDSSATDAVIDINEGGRFVVLWKDGLSSYARKYDFGSGTALNSRLDVNYPGANDRQLAIAVKPNNDYLIVYREDNFLGLGIWTRTVKDDGTLNFPDRIISVGSAEAPSIAMDAAGNYVISYTQLDGSGMGVKYISFDATDFQVNGVESVSQSTSGSQIAASVAMHDLDNFVVVWSGQGDQPGQVDSAGVFARQYGTAVVANTAPVADLTAGAPYTINEGDSLSLDGSNSSDANGDTLTFAWDLDNDGNFGETNEPTTATATVDWATLASFGIDDDGTYTIGLRVDDGNGGVTTQTTTVTVENSGPLLSITGSSNAVASTVYTLNLSATDAGDDSITSWRVDWGDGSIVTYVGNPSSVTHTYNVAGLSHNLLVSATDEDGVWFDADLFIATENSTPVYRYDALTGTFETGIGSDVTLTKARNMIFGADGLLYVTAFDTSNVQRFNPVTGMFVDEFVMSGSGGMDQADGIAFGPDGNLYVSSHRNDNVLRYDGTTGAFIDEFVVAGAGGMDHAAFLAFGTDGNLYVASERTDRILRFDGTTGAYIDDFIDFQSGGLTDSASFGFGPDGKFYVVSTVTDEVLRYDATGTFLDVFITAGLGGLDDPEGLAFGPDGLVYVTSRGNDNVLRFDASGNFVDEYIASAAGLSRPRAFAFSPTHQVTVSASNVAPVASNVNQVKNYLEGDATVGLDNIVVTEPDSGDAVTATLTLNLPGAGVLTTGTFGASTSSYDVTSGVWTVSGSVADVNAALADVSFTPAADNDIDAQVTVHLEDSFGAGPADGLIQLNVTPQNDPAFIDLDNDNSSGAPGTAFNAAFVEGGGPVFIADGADAVITDIDNSTLSSLTATITNALDGVAESLSADTSGTSITASFTGGTLTLSGVDSVANYQQVLRTVRYNNASSAPDPTTRTISLVANDGSADSNVASANVTVTPVNSAPTIVVPGTQSPTEDIPWQINGISFNDLDIGTGTMQFSFDVSRGSLTLDLTITGGVTAANVSGNGGSSLRVNVSLAQMNTTLAATNGLTYASDPNVSGADALVVGASDGAASSLANVDINVLPINDAPVAVADFYTMDPGSTLSRGPAGLLANDFDADGNTLTVVPVSGPSSGTLTLGSDGSFQFTPVASFSGTVTFSYAVTDGITTSAPATVVIEVSLPIRSADIQSVRSDHEPEAPPEEPPADDAEDADQVDEQEDLLNEISATDSGTEVPLVFTPRGVVQSGEETLLTLSVMSPRAATQTEAVVEEEEARTSSDSEDGSRSRRDRKESSRDGVSLVGVAKFDSKLLWSDMEELEQELKQGDSTPYLFAGSFAGVSSALSVGYVMWTVRGGLLATSLLAHLPAWSFVDPLLVLNEFEEDQDGEDDSLEEMLDKSESGKKEAHKTSPEVFVTAADDRTASPATLCEGR